MNAQSWGRDIVVAMGLSLALAGCGSEPVENLDNVEAALSVTNTLDEGGVKTPYGAQVAIGAATDHVLAVWVSTAGDLVGQPFANSAENGSGGGTPYGGKAHPVLTKISNTGRKTAFPAMAWDNNGNHFLVVWQDEYSATDHDIWGAFVDDKGDLLPLVSPNTNPFKINFDGDDETMPTVSYIKLSDAYGNFLVTYTRKLSNRTALTSQWVSQDSNANTDPASYIDTVSSGVSTTASRPTSAYIAAANIERKVLFTWNDNKWGFADFDFPVVSTVNTISGTTTGIVAGANATPGGNGYALAWKSGDQGTAKIRAQFFPEEGGDCYTTACANAVVDAISAGGSITNLHTPVISAAYKGFGVFAGTEEPTWHIAYKEISPSSGSSGSVTPNCAGALQSVSGRSLGSPGGVIAVATPPNLGATTKIRQYLMYDSYCGTPSSYPKEMVAAVNPATPSDVLSFNVSTNGN